VFDKQTVSRRRAIKSLGVAGAVGLAGCSGGGGNSEVVLTHFGNNVGAIIWPYINQRTNILENAIPDDANLRIQGTFDGTSLFLSGNSDIAADLTTIGAARAADEQDLDLSVVGRSQSGWFGLVAQAQSEYLPSNTGGAVETFEKLYDDQAPIGNFSWAISGVPSIQVLTAGELDLSFSEGGDFNIDMVDFAAIPGLVNDGELVTGVQSPSHGGGNLFYQEELDYLFTPNEYFAANDLGRPAIENMVVRDSFLEENEALLQGILDAFDEGAEWFMTDAADEVPGDDEFMQAFGTEDEAVAEYIMKFHQGDDVHGQLDVDIPNVYQEHRMSEDHIAEVTKFVNEAAAVGEAPENWQDLVTLVAM
jgi:hypothetical protein